MGRRDSYCKFCSFLQQEYFLVCFFFWGVFAALNISEVIHEETIKTQQFPIFFLDLCVILLCAHCEATCFHCGQGLDVFLVS